MSVKAYLKSYWKLDEGAANLDAVDSWTGGNTLARSNDPTSSAGKIKTCRTFAAASIQSFSIADNALLSIAGNVTFGFTAWVNMASKPAVANIISKRVGGGALEYWLRYVNASDRFEFMVSPDGTATATAVANAFGSPALATWYFIACWHDEAVDTVNIQVNNGAVNATAHTLGVFDGAAPFRLAAGNAAEFWDGSLDEIGFFKGGFPSAADRTALYHSGAGLPLSQFNDGLDPQSGWIPGGTPGGVRGWDSVRLRITETVGGVF